MVRSQCLERLERSFLLAHWLGNLKYRSLKILSPLGRGADRRGRSTRTVDCLKTAKRMGLQKKLSL
ncbi:hypothetical protein TYRP_018434 [Tyrophagus putrescentiae]|nr:hypothetical protein TYRP_018434 [Tyrophagus putrescentiae]